MRIGFDAYNPWVLNGNSVYTKNLIRALGTARPEVELHLFTFRRRLERSRGAIGTGPGLRYRPSLLHPLTLGSALEGPVRGVNNLILRAAASRLDLFHCTNPANYPRGVNKVVLTLLDLISLRDEDWVSEGSKRYYRRHIERILESAMAITTISEHTKRDLADHFPGAVEKTTVIHIAGNPVFRKVEPDYSVLKKHRISEGRRFVLYVGQYQPRKNIIGMLRAFASLDDDLRRDFAFVMAGSKMKHHMFEDISREIDAMKQSIDMKQLVDVSDEDLLHLYNAASLFVFVPFYEGFGVPVVEAMACGCPVLTSSTSSIPEVAGGAARLVDPSNVEEISDAMGVLLRDDDARSRLAEAGLRRSERFNWEKTAAETLRLYESCL
jgi:glycosyltransferase involved in cell wall biosynthesis